MIKFNLVLADVINRLNVLKVALKMWKTKHTIQITIVLGYLILEAYVGLGLSGRLTLLTQILLWIAFAGTCLGLYAGLKSRMRLAISGWVIAGLVQVWLQFDYEMSLKESQVITANSNRQENELLLAKAMARVPCGNGDTATLQMLNNPNTDRYSLSIKIIPANLTKQAYILVSTSGEYNPPDDKEIRKYQTKNMTDCSSSEYASLPALMDRLRAHYTEERHKYSKQ